MNYLKDHGHSFMCNVIVNYFASYNYMTADFIYPDDGNRMVTKMMATQITHRG